MAFYTPGVKHPSLPETFLTGGGGGAGTGDVLRGTTDPVNAPEGDSAVYYRTDTGSLWVWNGSTWVQFG